MSLAVRATVGGSDLVLAALSRLSLEPDDKTALLNQIGVNLVENARIRFSDQVSPDGQAWQPSIRAKNQGGDTMRDTGRLFASLTHVVSGNSVEYGTNVDYAEPLHFGAVVRASGAGLLKFKIPGVGFVSKKEVRIPARPFLGLDEEDESTVVDVINAFLSVQK